MSDAIDELIEQSERDVEFLHAKGGLGVLEVTSRLARLSQVCRELKVGLETAAVNVGYDPYAGHLELQDVLDRANAIAKGGGGGEQIRMCLWVGMARRQPGGDR